MKEDKLLDLLIDLARSLDIEVRTERGAFRDGDCRVENRNLIVLNRTSPTARKVTALSRALSKHSLDGVFLLPAVRDAIERVNN